jgi:hypothetical protein
MNKVSLADDPVQLQRQYLDNSSTGTSERLKVVWSEISEENETEILAMPDETESGIYINLVNKRYHLFRLRESIILTVTAILDT